MSEYKCQKCGKEFNELQVVPYAEYPGASVQNDYVSPCCGAGYEEKEEIWTEAYAEFGCRPRKKGEW